MEDLQSVTKKIYLSRDVDFVEDALFDRSLDSEISKEPQDIWTKDGDREFDIANDVVGETLQDESIGNLNVRNSDEIEEEFYISPTATHHGVESETPQAADSELIELSSIGSDDERVISAGLQESR